MRDWLPAYGESLRDEIGKGEEPWQNPPLIEEGDRRAFAWYNQNCIGFVKESGLLPQIFMDLGLKGAQKDLLLDKLNLIYATYESMQKDALEEEKNKWRT